MPFTSLLQGNTAQGAFKSPEELRRAFEQAGVDLQRPITCTCGSGATAAVLAHALTQLEVQVCYLLLVLNCHDTCKAAKLPCNAFQAGEIMLLRKPGPGIAGVASKCTCQRLMHLSHSSGTACMQCSLYDGSWMEWATTEGNPILKED